MKLTEITKITNIIHSFNGLRTFSLSFFTGTLILLTFSVLPELDERWYFALGIFSLSLLLIYKKYYQVFFILFFVCLGFFYALATANQIIEQRLPSDFEGEDLLVSGRAIGLPELKAGRLQFLFEGQSFSKITESNPEENAGIKRKLRVVWYNNDSVIVRSGSYWQLVIRCKRPRGFLNAGGFDYEKWLFSQRISATCYVRENELNHQLALVSGVFGQSLRQMVSERLQTLMPESPSRALASALLVAGRGEMTDEQWDVLQRTGTGHLLAISGLHIGLVAGFGFLPVYLLWWVFPRLFLAIPVRLAGAVSGGILALGYAMLAGFTLPTQRALVMVIVLMLGLLLRRRIPFSTSLCVALFLVLLVDPLAPLTAGFWLSFAAVALIYLFASRSLGKPPLPWVSVQLVIALGMLPFTAALFGSASLVSPVANVLAIPWVGLLVVPLILVGTLMLPFSEVLASLFWRLAGWLLDGLMWILEQLAAPDLALQHFPMVPLGWTLLAIIGVLLILLPKGVPGRWLGLLMVMPVAIWQPPPLKQGDFRLDVLDVGQGLASVVRTENYVLVFDAGPKSRSGFDTGEAVVVPWLRAHGIDKVDTLLISHADQDHSGGAQAVFSAMQPGRVLSGEVNLLADLTHTEQCHAGQAWQWDGVQFEVLHFASAYQHDKRNNMSCVLRVSNAKHSVLLPADIERSAEYWLVEQHGNALQSDVLVVPHHGSKTSSSPPFLKRVDPELAIVTAGYRNRFYHPHPSVVKRYQDWGIELLQTVDSGTVSIYFAADSDIREIEHFRKESKRFWHASPE